MPNTIVADPNDPCGFLAIAVEEADSLAEAEQAVLDGALAATRSRFIQSEAPGEIAYLLRFKDYLRNCNWPSAEIEKRRTAIDALERDWSAKQADLHLQLALKAAFDEDRGQAFAMITKAKPYIAKADALGIGDKFRDIAMRKVQVVEFTLGVKDVDDRHVKPRDSTPRPLDLAKSERRNANRFREPPLMAYFDGEVLATEDYSMVGLALSGYHGALDIGDRTTMSFGRTKMDLVTVEAEVRRRLRDVNQICVQFINAKADVYGYIAGVIRAQQNAKRGLRPQ